MNRQEAQQAYQKKKPVTLTKNVQELRRNMFPDMQGGFYTDPSSQVGKKLRIEHLEVNGKVPFVRLAGYGNIRPKIKTKAGDKVDLGELMIPLTAIEAFKE